MHRLILAALIGLSGCATTRDSGPDVFRNAATPIYSAAALDPARLAGTWSQVAAFSGPETPECGAGKVDFLKTSAGLAIEARLCLNGRVQKISGPLRPLGQGRFGVPGMETWWVLWVDSGYRTLAIGTPSGAFGFVLDRGAIPQDRLGAARELFDFNGYEARALRPL